MRARARSPDTPHMPSATHKPRAQVAASRLRAIFHFIDVPATAAGRVVGGSEPPVPATTATALEARGDDLLGTS